MFVIDNNCGLKNESELRIIILFVGRNEKERVVPQGCPETFLKANKKGCLDNIKNVKSPEISGLLIGADSGT